MTDPLRHLLARLDHDPAPIVTAADLKRWPAGALAALTHSGLLREIAPTASVVCEACDEGCVITPDLVENPQTGRVVGVHYCKRDARGRITIDLACLRQWEPHFDGLASFVARALGLIGAVVSVVPGRICLLGTIPTGGGLLEVFLARGLTWDDAAVTIERAGRLTASSGPAVVALRDHPPPGLWQGVRPQVLSLAEYVSWDETAGRIAANSVLSALQSLRPPVPEAEWLTVGQCAELLLEDVSGLGIKKASARVSWAAGAGKFRTNGEKGPGRRIERGSYSAWRLEQREHDLDAAD